MKIFIKNGKSYIQIAGYSLGDYFDKSTGPYTTIPKLKRKCKETQKWVFRGINRNNIFYCTHQGRKSGCFRSSILYSSEEKSWKDVAELICQKELALSKQYKEYIKDSVKGVCQRFQRLNFDALFVSKCKLPDDYQDVKKKVEEVVKVRENYSKLSSFMIIQ